MALICGIYDGPFLEDDFFGWSFAGISENSMFDNQIGTTPFQGQDVSMAGTHFTSINGTTRPGGVRINEFGWTLNSEGQGARTTIYDEAMGDVEFFAEVEGAFQNEERTYIQEEPEPLRAGHEEIPSTTGPHRPLHGNYEIPTRKDKPAPPRRHRSAVQRKQKAVAPLRNTSITGPISARKSARIRTSLSGQVRYGRKPNWSMLTEEIDLGWTRMQTEWSALKEAIEGEENHILLTKARKFEEILDLEIKEACDAEPSEAQKSGHQIQQALRRLFSGFKEREDVRSYRNVLDSLCKQLDILYMWSL